MIINKISLILAIIFFLSCNNDNTYKKSDYKDSIINMRDSFQKTETLDSVSIIKIPCDSELNNLKKMNNCDKINYLTTNTFTNNCFEKIVNYMSSLTKTKHHGSYGLVGFFYATDSLYKLDLKNWKVKLKCSEGRKLVILSTK